MISLKGKVVVVTGASMGIGEAIARDFAHQGASVILTSRKKASAEKIAKTLPGGLDKHLPVKADIRKLAEVKNLIRLTKKRYRRIDIWVNNAGVMAYMPVSEISDKIYDAIMDTNVRGVFYSLRELIPLFLKQKPDSDGTRGHIINISSSVARIGVAKLSIYSASKGALNLLSESVANEVRNDGIKLSVFAPASTKTNLGLNLVKRKTTGPATPSQASVKLTPEEVAEGVIYLARQNPNAWTSFADIRPLSVRR